MIVFVDTSAIYSFVDLDDVNHSSALAQFEKLKANGHTLVTHNYVLVESSALLQSRLGMRAVQDVHQRFFPALSIEWIDAQRHRTAVEMVLSSNRRKLSLVDCASFAVMRELGLETAFCFDSHFRDAGFLTVP